MSPDPTSGPANTEDSTGRPLGAASASVRYSVARHANHVDESPELLRWRADLLMDEMMLGGVDVSAADNAPLRPAQHDGSRYDPGYPQEDYSSQTYSHESYPPENGFAETNGGLTAPDRTERSPRVRPHPIPNRTPSRGSDRPRRRTAGSMHRRPMPTAPSRCTSRGVRRHRAGVDYPREDYPNGEYRNGESRNGEYRNGRDRARRSPSSPPSHRHHRHRLHHVASRLPIGRTRRRHRPAARRRMTLHRVANSASVRPRRPSMSKRSGRTVRRSGIGRTLARRNRSRTTISPRRSPNIARKIKNPTARSARIRAITSTRCRWWAASGARRCCRACPTWTRMR